MSAESKPPEEPAAALAATESESAGTSPAADGEAEVPDAAEADVESVETAAPAATQPADAAQPADPHHIPPATWAMPALSPERATRRRSRSGRFLGGVVPLVIGATVLPALVVGGLALELTQAAPAAAPAAPVAGAVDAELSALRTAADEVERDISSLVLPAQQMARLEARRAAVRGSILVEQEVRRLRAEQRHTLALEAALTRNPALANQAKKLPPVAPAALEPFLGRVGLTSPAESPEGEVVVDAGGNGIGAPVPAAFVAIVASVQEGPGEIDGLTSHRAPVPGTGLWVVAVRRLPVREVPASLGAMRAAVRSVENGLRMVPDTLNQLEQRQSALSGRAREAAIAALVVGLLCLLGVWRELRARVMRPLKDLRAQLERVRANARPLPHAADDPLADLHACLVDLAERLQESRAINEQQTQRSAALDNLMETCRRAQRGDLTARPSLAQGSEGLVAMALTHLLDAVEERAVRVRVQARRLVGELHACEQAGSPLTHPPVRENLETLRARLDGLSTVPHLMRTLAARMESVAQHLPGTPSADDLQRVAAAVTPRAAALASLITDLQQAHERLACALKESCGPSLSESLQRAREAAQDLAREGRATRTDESFPSVVAAMRDLPVPEVERALALDAAPESLDKPA